MFQSMFKGTIFIRDDFDAGAEAEKLRNACTGLGTDEAVILDVMGNHTNEQRLEIAEAFKVAYGKDLIEELKSELGGNFEDLCVAMLAAPRVYDARCLHDAVSGAGTDESVLAEIMCTRTNDQINEIKEAYKAEFDVELEEDLQSDTSGYFGRLMISLVQAGRENDDWEWMDEAKAAEEAQKFFDAGEGAWGSEEAEMNQVLCLNSPGQLREIIRQYEVLTEGKTMEEAISTECSGPLKEGYLAIVESVKDKPKYYARRLRSCMAGWGTSDQDLIRIIVARSEIDMGDIAERYEAMYETPLADAVADECSGEYKRLLLAIIKTPE